MTDTIRQDAWQAFLASLPPDHLRALAQIHAWIRDTIVYRQEIPGRNHWQAPQETLATGQGDCEDFAILAYASVRLYGLPAYKVRLAHLDTRPQAHMVCIVRIGNTSILLDNTKPTPVLWESADQPVIYMMNEIATWTPSGNRPTNNREWSHVLGQLQQLDDTFIAEMEGA